jgi:UDP-N-acetyl-2-amino-2-deoxyglucuronate dehydrogenase
MTRNFAILGVGGFVAPRHLEAIARTGHRLLAACDPSDSVGVLDRAFPEAAFFTETERFDRYLEKQRRLGEEERVHYVSICSPNHLHDAHVRLALRTQATAICEKPLVISPWNLDQLARLEEETGSRVYTVLQLRQLPALVALRARLQASQRERPDVVLTYVTRRGPWYQVSWKGVPEKSGGLITNIGAHLLDLMLWLFGPVQEAEVHLSDRERVAGVLELERARVRWFLSVSAADLPEPVRGSGRSAYRALQLPGETLEFTEGFTELHTRVYEEILQGRGLGIEDARPSIELAHRLRGAEVRLRPGAHPWVGRPTESS